MITEVINKINITAEAVFDYEEALGLGRLDKRFLKSEIEEYITRMNRGGRLICGNCFRCKYLDEESGLMLILFLYRAERISVIQYWRLAGICVDLDWAEEAEENGFIRCWVKTGIIDLPAEDDWAVGLRVNKILRYTKKTLFENVLKEVLDGFEYGGDKETAKKLVFLQSYYFGRKRKRTKEKNGYN